MACYWPAMHRFPDLGPLALALAIGLLVGLERGWSAAWPLVASVAVAGAVLLALAFGHSGA